MTSDRTGFPPERHDGGSSPAGSDLVERLVRLAGAGPEIPADGADRVKAALRPEWLREVGRRRQRRAAVWGSAGLAAAAALVAALLLTTSRRPVPPPAPATAGRIAAVRGRLEIVPPAERARPLAPAVGAEVAVGTELRTGPDSHVALELPGGASVRLDRDTSARFASQRAVVLHAGAVYVDSGLAPLGTIEVRTPLGTARETGTQFEVRHADDGLVVRVREGSVSLSRRDDSFEVGAGTMMIVLADGSTRRGTTRPDGPDWQWAAEAAPALEIEGQSAAVFLRWVSRETGLGLRFGDDAVEQFAESTVLHGTIEGLSPVRAAEVVLPSCGLQHRVSAGTLVVERPAGDRPEP